MYSLHHQQRDSEAAAQRRHDRCFANMYDTIMDALRIGADIPLRIGSNLSPTGFKTYPLSTFLGECSREAQKHLFHACFLAANNDRADQVRAELMRFAEIVAKEYAADFSDLYSDD